MGKSTARLLSSAGCEAPELHDFVATRKDMFSVSTQSGTGNGRIESGTFCYVDCMDALSRFEIPVFHFVAITGAHGILVVGTKCDHDGVVMVGINSADTLPGGQVPVSQGLGLASTQGCFSIGADCDGIDGLGVASEGANAFSRAQIPVFYSVVFAAAQCIIPVGTDCDSTYEPRVPS